MNELIKMNVLDSGQFLIYKLIKIIDGKKEYNSF